MPALQLRKVKLGVTTSVAEYLGANAEIYPEQRNGILALTYAQHEILGYFYLIIDLLAYTAPIGRLERRNHPFRG